MKKTKIVIVPIIISLLLVTMSMLLSGCAFIDVYLRKPSNESLFGIPTGYYSLIDEDIDSAEAIFDVIYIDNDIEFIENYIDTYSSDIYQGEDGQVCLGNKNVPVEKRILIKYFYEKNILEVHYPHVILRYKKDKLKILENYGIPKGTYNLVEEDLLANNEISTELIVDGGVEFGGVKYDFSQDEDGKINILNSETTDKKQIIYFYKDELLEVRWNEDLIFHFKQNETK